MNLQTPYDMLSLAFHINWRSCKEYGKDYSFEVFCDLLIQDQQKLFDEGKIGGVGTQVMNEVVAFSEPKETIPDQSLGLEVIPSNPERALSAIQLPIVTTAVGWLIRSMDISYVGWSFIRFDW